jgi:hypothetical protein
MQCTAPQIPCTSRASQWLQLQDLEPQVGNLFFRPSEALKPSTSHGQTQAIHRLDHARKVLKLQVRGTEPPRAISGTQ